MEIEERDIYKVTVYLPEDHLEKIMDAVQESMRSVYPGYDRAFSYFPVTGTWRPLEGSDPHSGKVDEISVEREMRLEFAVFGSDLLSALKAVRDNHPYEVPAIDVVPMMSGLRILESHSLGRRE